MKKNHSGPYTQKTKPLKKPQRGPARWRPHGERNKQSFHRLKNWLEMVNDALSPVVEAE
jgi:hypothetical protein